LLDKLNYALFGRSSQQPEVIPEEPEQPKKKKINKNKRRKNRNRNRQKLLDTDRSSSGCLQTEEVHEDSKSIERCVIKAIPEPSSEEGWTAVPEIVKKKKTKKSTKQNAKNKKDNEKQGKLRNYERSRTEVVHTEPDQSSRQSQLSMKESENSGPAQPKQERKMNAKQRHNKKKMERRMVKKLVFELIDQ
jgi:hypothetical protein